MTEATEHVPFNGDSFIGEQIRELVERYHIQTIVETGTWSGHTTRELIRIGPRVVTIDATHEHLLEEFGPAAVKDIERLGIVVVLGDSSKILSDVIMSSIAPMLFYLDAHGGGANGSNVNPLLEELDIIGESVACRDCCVIVVHDFQVPDKPWGHNGGDWDIS